MRLHSSNRLQPASFAALVLLAALAALTAVARATPYWSSIHAVVLSVDYRHHTLTIRHEALETAPAGLRVCEVRDSRQLQHLRGGEYIEARAETSQTQWVLDGIRVVGRSGSSQRGLTRMALR